MKKVMTHEELKNALFAGLLVEPGEAETVAQLTRMVNAVAGTAGVRAVHEADVQNALEIMAENGRVEQVGEFKGTATLYQAVVRDARAELKEHVSEDGYRRTAIILDSRKGTSIDVVLADGSTVVARLNLFDFTHSQSGRITVDVCLMDKTRVPRIAMMSQGRHVLDQRFPECRVATVLLERKLEGEQ